MLLKFAIMESPSYYNHFAHDGVTEREAAYALSTMSNNSLMTYEEAMEGASYNGMQEEPHAIQDDANYDLIWNWGEVIDKRYRIVKLLGKGAYGQVVKTIDEQENKAVAIKIIKNKNIFTRQAKIEVQILETLMKYDPKDQYNCVKYIRSFEFKDHLCLVFELLWTDAYLLLSEMNFDGLPMSLVKGYTWQVLNCLNFLDHLSPKVIHADLKPENILLGSSSSWDKIKVIDFGSSCFENEKIFTYVQSRFYRSPEVILGIPYSNAIDMWSLGCIVMELFTGKPLFAGANEAQIMYQISTTLGLPPVSMLKQSKLTNKYFFLTGPDIYEPRVPAGVGPNMPLNDIIDENRRDGLPSEDMENLKDMLFKMLQIDPNLRCKPQAILQHPFLAN